MLTFLKANISATIASLFDYLVTIFLVSFIHANVLIGNITGNVFGGILNYIIGRTWAFDSRERKVKEQAFRYAIVWIGNLILNTGGMYILTVLLKVQYVIAKLIVSLVVGICYNYVLQKHYVFKKN